MTSPAAFVAGWPIAHSRSPLIHGYWLKRYGIDGDYRREAVPPEDAATFFRAFGERGYAGGNVTIPHKQTAWQSCEALTPTARQLGAANTLWRDSGVLWGDNTDVYGFAANLDDRSPGWGNAASALVIGAGGAARAVVGALINRGVKKVSVLNRTVDRALYVAALFGDTVAAGGLDALPVALAAAELVVNTTAAGMHGSEPLAVDWNLARSDALVTDIVYVPLVTPFLAGAAAAGLRTVDGLGMLLHQAVPGFERWFGVRPEVDAALRQHILADLAR